MSELFFFISDETTFEVISDLECEYETTIDVHSLFPLSLELLSLCLNEHVLSFESLQTISLITIMPYHSSLNLKIDSDVGLDIISGVVSYGTVSYTVLVEFASVASSNYEVLTEKSILSVFSTESCFDVGLTESLAIESLIGKTVSYSTNYGTLSSEVSLNSINFEILAPFLSDSILNLDICRLVSQDLSIPVESIRLVAIDGRVCLDILGFNASIFIHDIWHLLPRTTSWIIDSANLEWTINPNKQYLEDERNTVWITPNKNTSWNIL